MNGLLWCVQGVNYEQLPVTIAPEFKALYNRATAVWREVLPDRAPHNDPATSLLKQLAVEHDLLLVAIHGAAVVGTVMGGYDGHRGWVYSLAVKPEHQRSGIGTALVRRLEQALAQRGCLKVNLQVRASNAGVVASKYVREFAHFGGADRIGSMVPDPVFTKLKEKFS